MNHTSMSSIIEMGEHRGKTSLVPVTLGEGWGPATCKKCGEHEAWTIWVTPEVKKDNEFFEIFRSHGEARCKECGPPTD